MNKSARAAATAVSHVQLRREPPPQAPNSDAIAQASKHYEARILNRVRPVVLPRDSAPAAQPDRVDASAPEPDEDGPHRAWVRARTKAVQEPSAGDANKVTQTSQSGSHEPETLANVIGEMWWERTDVHFPSGLGGMNASFQADGLHLFGSLTWQDGDLWQGSLQVVGKYVLDPSRMPAGGPGWFTSRPSCNFFGTLSAYAGAAFGDNWSKCWMHTSQVALGGPGWPVLGENHGHQNLYFLSQDGERAVKDLPGHINFPPIDFFMDPAFTLVIFLETRLDFQLEGDSGTKFGVREVFQDAILRYFQWTIQRL
jgi:hypothetical protein